VRSHSPIPPCCAHCGVITNLISFNFGIVGFVKSIIIIWLVRDLETPVISIEHCEGEMWGVTETIFNFLTFLSKNRNNVEPLTSHLAIIVYFPTQMKRYQSCHVLQIKYHFP
jgi:hypothetical protein